MSPKCNRKTGKRGVGRKGSKVSEPKTPEEINTPQEEILQEQVHHDVDIDDDTQSCQSDSIPTKKSKVDFSPEEDQNMIEWLEENPVLYNKKLSLYKDTAKKEKIWRDKAVEMGKSVDVLKVWYGSLRSRYGKLKKRRSGSEDADLTERDDWVLRNFEFLRPHIYEVQKKTIVSVS